MKFQTRCINANQAAGVDVFVIYSVEDFRFPMALEAMPENKNVATFYGDTAEMMARLYCEQKNKEIQNALGS